MEGADEKNSVPGAFVWDRRTKYFRAPAYKYRDIITEFVRSKTEYEDAAKSYSDFDFKQKFHITPRPYQTESIEAWRANKRNGVIVLPTGAGKTHAATMAIEMCGRQTLVVVPTLDLMNQWYDLLLSTFNAEIGLIGGGFYEIGAITVTTYASAFRHQERLGNQFGLVIFDECHHLPSEGYKYAAEFAIAPFRLGLSATPDRDEIADALLEEIVGKFVYRLEAQDIAGEYLADYIIERIEVDLSEEERRAYDRERQIYTDFKRYKNLPYGQEGWRMFLIQSAKSEDGRRAMKAYRNQKKIALGTDSKLQRAARFIDSPQTRQNLNFYCRKRDGLSNFERLPDTGDYARNQRQRAQILARRIQQRRGSRSLHVKGFKRRREYSRCFSCHNFVGFGFFTGNIFSG